MANLNGTSGNDTINGSLLADTINAGAGNDTVTVRSTDGFTYVDLGAGSDTGELLVGADGTIYGTTLLGGMADEGVVFRYSETLGLQALVEFTGIAGACPGSAGGSDSAGLVFTGGLAFGSDGLLYGVAPSGGAGGGGVVFRLTLPPPMSDWKTLHLGDANAPDLDDFDHDGISNLLEYALLTAPDVADPDAVPAAAITAFPDGNRLAIDLPRDPAHSDVTVVVEVSDSLLPGSWTTLATSSGGNPFAGPGYFNGDSVSPGLKTVTIRDTQSAAISSKRFIRIRAAH